MNLGVGKPTIPSPSKKGSIKPPQFIFKTKPNEKKKITAKISSNMKNEKTFDKQSPKAQQFKLQKKIAQ